MIGILISIWRLFPGAPLSPPPTRHILAETGDTIIAENGDSLKKE